MRIQSLTIKAFGKFHDMTLNFDDGLNVIYGLNEAGKSTVHKFIEVMFYGFYKAYTKNKLYEVEYDHYIPWDYPGYGGTLTFSDAGKSIRMERQLLRGKDKLQIFDVESGEDITNTYDYNKVIKLADPALKHIGHNKVTYRNTVSMTQMESKTDEDMIREIKDNMSNLASSHQSSISVDKVIERIEKDENSIGSNRKRTSPYYKLGQDLKDLQKSAEEAKERQRLIYDEKLKEQALKKSLELVEKEREGLELDIAYLVSLKSEEILKKAEALETEKRLQEEKIRPLEDYKSFNVDVSQKLNQQFEKLDKLKLELTALEKNQQLLKERSHQAQENLAGLKVNEEDSKKYALTNQAIYEYEEIESKIGTKKLEKQNIQQQYDFTDHQLVVVKPHFGLFLAAIVALSGMFLGWLVEDVLYILIVVGAITGYYFYKRYKAHLKEDQLTKNKLTKLQQQMSQLDQKIDDGKDRMTELLAKNDVATFFDLKLKRDELLSKKSVYEANQVRRQQLLQSIELDKKQLDEAKRLKTELISRLEEAESRCDDDLSKYKLRGKSDISNGLEKHLQYQSGLQAKENIELRLKELLNGKNMDDFKAEAVVEKRDVILEDEEAIRDQLNRLNEQLVDLNKEISASKTKSETIGVGKPTVAELVEKIQVKEQQLKEFDHDLSVYKLMKETIGKIAIDIQNNFAPVLNDKMSEVVSEITNAKYKDIKVNPEMALTIYDEKAHRTIQVDSLSAGTIDILYFGLRLGISDVLTEGKKLPLILDDTFVQYDDVRMKQAVDLLGQSGRQVLLFTCHQREIDYLEKQDKSFKKIEL